MRKYIEKIKNNSDKKKMIRYLKYGTFVLAACAVLRGVMVAAGGSVTVSNSVDGRELPIYCVETSEKKISLSFDAACADGKLR
ncbi:MAG: hypothetical protein ACI4E5_03725 [Suilimivivens sp.]